MATNPNNSFITYIATINKQEQYEKILLYFELILPEEYNEERLNLKKALSKEEGWKEDWESKFNSLLKEIKQEKNLNFKNFDFESQKQKSKREWRRRITITIIGIVGGLLTGMAGYYFNDYLENKSYKFRFTVDQEYQKIWDSLAVGGILMLDTKEILLDSSYSGRTQFKGGFKDRVNSRFLGELGNWFAIENEKILEGENVLSVIYSEKEDKQTKGKKVKSKKTIVDELPELPYNTSFYLEDKEGHRISARDSRGYTAELEKLGIKIPVGKDGMYKTFINEPKEGLAEFTIRNKDGKTVAEGHLPIGMIGHQIKISPK